MTKRNGVEVPQPTDEELQEKAKEEKRRIANIKEFLAQ